MGEFENEFINNAINTDGSTDQFQFSVCGITENEAIAVESRQSIATHATCELVKS